MLADYKVVPLKSLIRTSNDKRLLEMQLREFSCSRDDQLEKFIHEQAIPYEVKGFSRTYLVYAVGGDAFEATPSVAAFFTLAITATDYSEISKSKREKVLGSKPGRNTFNAFGGILIGQLARDDRYGRDFIDGQALLRECETYIEMGRQYIGGRIVYLDCKDVLVNTYLKSRYKLLTNDPSPEGYHKMYKVLPDMAIAP